MNILQQQLGMKSLAKVVSRRHTFEECRNIIRRELNLEITFDSQYQASGHVKFDSFCRKVTFMLPTNVGQGDFT